MILADKIIALRKKNGWSQEELAEKMNVTRQSVSKWEGAQSVPDLEKILQMSRIFGVSTDYLLKDEMGEAEYVEASDGGDESGAEYVKPMRRVSMEEANEFLRVKEYTAKRIAVGVFLCIISPVCLIMLAAASEGPYKITEQLATGAGMIVLLLLIAAAVAIFISSGSKTAPFAWLETEPFETEYGVSGMVKERQKQFKDTYNKYNVLGACFCILSIIPLFGGIMISEAEMFIVGMTALLLILVGIGVFFFITAGIQWESMQKLLQEGDYTKSKKKRRSAGDVLGPVFWPVITAVYLGWSFVTGNWEYTWIIWPVAALLYVALVNLVEALRKKDRV